MTENSNSIAYAMFLTGRLREAIRLAQKVHEGQTDKGGRPYIEHPMTVRLLVAPQGSYDSEDADVMHCV